MKNFEEQIGYIFQDKTLLEESLTHPSLTRKVGRKNYQRLEFLGDKVLSLVVSEFLFTHYDQENEGDLSKRQAFLVSGGVLAEIALEIGLDGVFMLSSGEEKMGGRQNKNNLENVLEALIGAIYLDSSYNEAKRFVLQFWGKRFSAKQGVPKDPVSFLQEVTQTRLKILPQYKIEQCGGSHHSPEFEARVLVEALGVDLTAKGASKKEAQKRAAQMALDFLEGEDLGT